MAALSSEIVALVHHIELHESSWWDETTRRIALACLLDSRTPLDMASVQSILLRRYGLRCGSEEVTTALDKLESDGQAVAVDTGHYTASQDARSESRKAVAEFNELERLVAAHFATIVAADCGSMSLTPTWAGFRDECLMPLLSQEGAQAAALSLGCGNGNRGLGELVTEYVARHDPDAAAGFGACIQHLLGNGDDSVREYILRQLDAQFIVSAAGLDSDTISALTAAKSAKLTLRLVLDTNFLFSVLGWHDHPSNEVAAAVLEVARSMDGNVRVELLVLPTTVEETQQAITRKAERLENIHWTRSLAEAALEFGVPGLVAQYLESQAKTDFSLSLVEYADLISHDLETRLQDLGVLPVYDDISAYSMKQDVLDSIKDQLDFETATRPVAERRDYQLIKHDMIAYHWVTDQRPPALKTAVDAGYWLVTLDFRLLGFDRYKCRGRARAQVCLHPSTAIQFLQFWVPRSDALRSAIFSSVQQPLLPASSLAETERVTYRIIERLGTLGGIEEISADAIRSTLADKVLQNRMRTASGQQQELEVVEEAFVRLASKREEELNAERSRAEDLRRELTNSQETIRKQQEIEEGRRVQADRLKRQAKEAATRAEELDQQLGGRDKSLIDVGARLDSAELDAARWRWRLTGVVVPAVVIGLLVLAGGAVLFLMLPFNQRALPLALLSVLGLLAWVGWVDRSARRDAGAAGSKLAAALSWANKWIWYLIVGVAISLVASIMWDVIKSAFHLFSTVPLPPAK